MITEYTRREIGAMSLPELMPHWCDLLWWCGMRPFYRRMLEIGLTLPEHIVLRTLQHGTMTVAGTADCMHISHSAASRAVDRLVQDGLVARQENPEDRRQKQLTLTPAGTALIEELGTMFAQGMSGLVEMLEPAKQEQFRSLMAEMIAAQLDQFRATEAGCSVIKAPATPATSLVEPLPV